MELFHAKRAAQEQMETEARTALESVEQTRADQQKELNEGIGQYSLDAIG